MMERRSVLARFGLAIALGMVFAGSTDLASAQQALRPRARPVKPRVTRPATPPRKQPARPRVQRPERKADQPVEVTGGLG